MIFTRSLSLESKLPTNPFKSCSIWVKVVYKVACCCYKKYIGETGRTIEERIKEHQTNIKNEKSLQKKGLSQPLRESEHTTKWEEAEILAKENNILKRKLKKNVL